MSENRKSREPAQAHEVVDAFLQMAQCLGTVRLPRGLSRERLEMLQLIDSHGPIGVSPLAKLARVRPATTSRMIAALVQQGLVRKKGDKVDLRAVKIGLTTRGRQTLKRARRLLIERTALALEKLPAAESARLPDLANKLKAFQEEGNIQSLKETLDAGGTILSSIAGAIPGFGSFAQELVDFILKELKRAFWRRKRAA